MSFNARDFFTAFAVAVNGRNYAALRHMIHPEFVASIPQSGERAAGFDAFIDQMQAYPGGAPEMPSAANAQIIGDDDRWAITPSYTVVPLSAGNEFVVVAATRYPDGKLWHTVSVVEIRDEQLYRIENYFAPEMEAPLLGAIGRGSPG